MVGRGALNGILRRSFLGTFPKTIWGLGRAGKNCRPESFYKYTLNQQKNLPIYYNQHFRRGNGLEYSEEDISSCDDPKLIASPNTSHIYNIWNFHLCPDNFSPGKLCGPASLEFEYNIEISFKWIAAFLANRGAGSTHARTVPASLVPGRCQAL
jgi:hypothetical protein